MAFAPAFLAAITLPDIRHCFIALCVLALAAAAAVSA